MRGMLLYISIVILCFYTVSHTHANDGYFIVTAYYSPLPDQDYYATGSYEGDIRLNGRGTNGASGREVFSGMLAAPKKYTFGTHIYLEGLGVGIVEDRGGAIVPAGERGYSYDRIDVWMGYGDEGLRRANYWGKRKISGSIVSSSTPTPILNYKNIPAPISAAHNLTPNISSSKQTKVSSTENSGIKELREFLIEYGHLNASFKAGDQDKILRNALIRFQVQEGIIENPDSYGAGYYGPKTRNAMSNIQKGNIKANEQEEETSYSEKDEEVEAFSLQGYYEEILQKTEQKALNTMNSISIARYKDTGEHISSLQETLRYFGYFEAESTGYFGVKTREALIEYQVRRMIIESSESPGAGLYGPKTRARFLSDLKSNYFYEEISESHLRNDMLNLFHNSH